MTLMTFDQREQEVRRIFGIGVNARGRSQRVKRVPARRVTHICTVDRER